MAIIYTYPNGPAALQGDELIVISDVNNENATRNTTAQAIADLAEFTITFRDNEGTGLIYSPNTVTTPGGTVDLTGTLVETHGGTGISSYTTGDMLYADAANSLSVIGIGAPGHVLTSNGTIPTWSAIPVQPAEDLATTLAAGNDTGGNNINVTGTDQIVLNENILQLNTVGDANNTLSYDSVSGNTTFEANRNFIVNTAQGVGARFSVGAGFASEMLIEDPSGGNRLILNPTNGWVRGLIGTFTGTLQFPTNTSSQTYTLPTDETGVIPVGPAWNTLIASPTAGENGYVITWVDASNEYQLLAAPGGGGGGIYSGSGSLTGSTTVTMGANDLTFDTTGGDFLVNNNVAPDPVFLIDGGTNTVGMGGNATLIEQLSVYNANGSGNTTALGIYGNNTTGTQKAVTIGITAAATTNTALEIRAAGATSGNNYALLTDGGNSGFGTTTPDPSAIVEINSSTQGLLLPRWNNTEQSNNTAAWGTTQQGMTWFNTDTNQFMGWNGTAPVILG